LFCNVREVLPAPEKERAAPLRHVDSEMYKEFLTQLTLIYEFDYMEMDLSDSLTYIQEFHASVKEKRKRTEGQIFMKKGPRPQKARAYGFDHELSQYYISFLMCVPGISENKAIEIAKKYPTVRLLMDELDIDSGGKGVDALAELPMNGTNAGGSTNKLGKNMAERILKVFMSSDPNYVIDT